MRIFFSKVEQFKNVRDKSGYSFYDFSTSWYALTFFISLVGGCVLWNTFVPFNSMRFDPYPYNGLRTVLTLIASIQSPLLLLYSKKSTDYRKKLLEKDYELEKIIYQKIEKLERELMYSKSLQEKELSIVSQFLTNEFKPRKRKILRLK